VLIVGDGKERVALLHLDCYHPLFIIVMKLVGKHISKDASV
jgi:hypothetical protein